MGGGNRNRRHKAKSSASASNSVSQSARSQQTDANFDDIVDRFRNLHVTTSDDRTPHLITESDPAYPRPRIPYLNTESGTAYPRPPPLLDDKTKFVTSVQSFEATSSTRGTSRPSANVEINTNPRNRKKLSSGVQTMPTHIVDENVPSPLPVRNRASVRVRKPSAKGLNQEADTQPSQTKPTVFPAPQLVYPEPDCDILFHSMSVSTGGNSPRRFSSSVNSVETKESQRPTSPTLQAVQRLRRKSVQVGMAHGKKKAGEDIQDITAETLGGDENSTEPHTQISWAEESTLTKKEAMDAMAHLGLKDKREESSNAEAKEPSHKYSPYSSNLTLAQSDVYLPPHITQQPIQSNKPATDGLVETSVSPVSSEPVNNERSTSFSSWEFESKEDVSQSFEVLPQPSRFATAHNGSERRWYRLWRH
jgi:hypothetical protein